MYIESLHYKNIGPLSDLNIQFRKNEKGVPIPLVVVGKNGSGKSILLQWLFDIITDSRADGEIMYILLFFRYQK